jgi:hypothetical protein
MIERQFDVDWRWVKRMTTFLTWQHLDPFANRICSHGYKMVRINHDEWFDYERLPSFSAGKNLQICFMNEAASDSESSDSETCPKLSQGMSRKKNVQRPSSLMKHRNASLNNNPYSSHPLSVAKSAEEKGEREIFMRFPGDLRGFSSTVERPTTLSLGPPTDPSDNNFFTHQARLQIEARMALAQAKDMAHMQMEVS